MDTIKKTSNMIKKCIFFGNDIQEIFVLKMMFTLIFYWTIFASLVYAQKPISETVLVICNNKQYFGKLLYVTETDLILWQSTESYNPDNMKDYLKQLHFSEIERIVIDKKGQFWKGAGYGLIIGGGSGAIAGILKENNRGGNHLIWTLNSGNRALEEGLKFGIPSALIGGIAGAVLSSDKHFEIHKDKAVYQAVMPELKKRAIFPFIPPKELQAFLTQND